MKQSAVALLGLLVFFGRVDADAHEFWIEPSSHRPAAGTVVDVQLRLGHGRDTQTVDRVDDDEWFALVAGEREERILKGADADPAGRVTIPAPGCWWIAFAGGRAFSALPPAAFEEYLGDKGLDAIATARAVRGRRERYGTEIYSRCAKALLSGRGCDASPEAQDAIRQPVGLTLELIPEKNPSRLHPGDRLPVRVLFRGEPVANALVEAFPDADRTRATRERTTADGRVGVPLTAGGRWVIATVHMEAGSGPEVADWESWWASLSFELHGARWHELRYDQRRFIPGIPFPTSPAVPQGR